MGCGIWSMHFTAMLAFQLPIEVSYNIPLTLFSLVLAVISSGFGLFYCNTLPILPRKVVVGGIAMGVGVVGMHYTGMAAMQMNATMYYTPGLFTLSIVIALGAASAALWLLVHANNILKNKKGFKIISALTMGIAVFGMHFTGMTATNFVSNERVLKNSLIPIDANWLAIGISTFILITLGIAILTSFIQRIASQEARTQAILDGVVDGIITIDKKGIILSFNRASERIFGYMECEILGRNVKLLMPDPYREEHDRYLQKYLDTGQSKIIGVGREVVGLKKDGKTFPLDLSVSQIIINDKVNFTGIFRDISEIKMQEDRLKDAVKAAEKANRAKSEFLSRMSHELRTPMNAILGFSQLLRYDTKNPLTDSQKVKVEEVLKGGKHLLELINEILDLSRIESGQLDLSVDDILVSNLIADTLALISPMAAQRNIQITNHLSNHPELSIKADRTRFKQVLLNLLSNAVKYNQEDGSITLDFQKSDDDRIRIDIIDTGAGISEDNQNLLFQPFNRLEVDHLAVEGTGIGLTITKRLIELMNGTISVQSTIGEGSRFSIEIPEGKQVALAQENRVINPVLKESKEIGEQEWTLLYVEDNPANLMLVEQILQSRSDIKLLSAPQALMGIELARAHKPDLILMDINMPGMDGITAMKKLQNYEETNNIPILAVSANAMESDIKKGLDAGFKGYITKPFDIPKFFVEIDRFLKLENSTLVDST